MSKPLIQSQYPVLLTEKEISHWLVNPYLHAATSENTRKAYRNDIKHYENWGGKLPATPEQLIQYLEAHANSLNPRTLSRRITAIKHWHTYQGFIDPTAHPVISKTLIGISRLHGRPKHKAPALTPEELKQIIASIIKNDSLTSYRDNALLQIGYFGALRRSELVAIHVEHISWQEKGIEILLPTSKTDQTHAGQFCVIPYGHETLCPIQALEQWLQQSHINQGPIFRRILSDDRVGDNALTPLSVNLILKQRAMEAGLKQAETLSSHSLRRGLATSAASAGAPLHAIMRAGRWKQTNTVMEYIETSDRFNDNAAANVLKKMKTKE